MTDIRVDGTVVDSISGTLRAAADLLPASLSASADGCGSMAVERAAAELLSWARMETAARRTAVEALDADLRAVGTAWDRADAALRRTNDRSRPV